MKFCTKCTCVQYCSGKCQANDWKKVHRASGCQILWLRHAIFFFEQLEPSDKDFTIFLLPSPLEASEDSDEASDEVEVLAYYFVAVDESKNS